MDSESVEANLRTDLYKGLSEKEALRRRRKNGENRIWQVNRASATRYARDCVADLTTVLLVICAVFAAILEGSTTAVSVCAVLLVGIAFRVAAYIRAKRIFEKMADEGVPNATVVRDGSAKVVRAVELVKGDVVILGEGDVAPCDGRIISNGEVKVSEKGITDNKSSVIKRDTVIVSDVDGAEIPCEYRVNMLFAGSVILSGTCRMVVTACSDDSLVCMKDGGIIVPSGESLPTIKRFEKWSLAFNLFMIALILIVSVISIPFRGTGNIAEVFFGMLSLAAASVSTYFGAASYIILAVPIRDAANQKRGSAIVKDCSNIENTASVKRIVASDVSTFKNGESRLTSFWDGGLLFPAGKGDPSRLFSLLFAAFSVTESQEALSADFETERDGKNRLIERTAEHASSVYGKKISPTLQIMDKSTDNQNGSIIETVVALRGGTPEAISAGRVDAVLSVCDRYVTVDGTEFLSDKLREEIRTISDEAISRGERVFAVATRQSPYTYIKHISILQSRMRFEGFICISEGADRDVSEYARRLRDLGISFTVLTSDPDVDSAFLKKSGILDGEPIVIDNSSFIAEDDLPGGDYLIAVPSYGDPGLKKTAISNIRCSVVGKIVKDRDDVSVITKEALDSRMMNGKTVGIAVSSHANRPIPQTLKRRSKITVYPDGPEGCGGFKETSFAILSAMRGLRNLSGALLYTVFSQTARIAAALIAAFSGVGLKDPVGILLLGIVLDFLSILTLAFRSDSLSISNERAGTVSLKKAGLYALTGIITGVIAGVVPLSGFFSGSVSSGASTASFLSLLLCEFVAATFIFMRGRSKNEKLPVAYILYSAAIAVLFVIVSFISPVSLLVGDGSPALSMIAFSLIPPALVFPLLVLTSKIPADNGDKMIKNDG